MKDIIVLCKNPQQIKNICHSIPISMNRFSSTADALVNKIMGRVGNSAAIRIENGSIHGYDYYGNYNSSQYTKYNYEEFVSDDNLLYRSLNDYNNCLINPRTKDEACELVDILPVHTAGGYTKRDWKGYWDCYNEHTYYCTDNGIIRYYGDLRYIAIDDTRFIVPFSDVKDNLLALKFLKDNHTLEVRIEHAEQLSWISNNLHLGMFSEAVMWSDYDSDLVLEIHDLSSVFSYRKRYDAVTTTEHRAEEFGEFVEVRNFRPDDTGNSVFLTPSVRFRSGAWGFVNEEELLNNLYEIEYDSLPVIETTPEQETSISFRETYISFEEFKTIFETFKKAEKKAYKCPATKYIKCKNIFEARVVCNTYESMFIPFSNVDWLKCWGKEDRTVFKLVNNKIAGLTTEKEARKCGATVTRFSTVFRNIEENFKICDHCGNIAESGEVDSNGKIICQECLKNYVICEECGHLEHIDNITTCDNVKLCSSCCENITSVCMDCGERHIKRNMTADSDGNMLCQSCATHYYRCDRCNRFVHEDNIMHDDGYSYCEECYDISLKEHSIKDYYYKPSPIFYGADCNSGKRLFGVELEVDDGEESSYNAYEVLQVANVDNNHIYIKHDGSLDDGFEVVSHPMTLDYYMSEMNWKDTMKKLINLGYYSHQTDTCGLHVHVNRVSLGSSESERDETIAKILFFVEQHWNEVVKFTRRNMSNLTRWANRYGYETEAKKILDKAKGTSNRYCAVNLRNEYTIEFRIFRGTLNYNTFIATLQFVNKVCELAMLKTEEQIAAMSWIDFVETVTEPELLQYLKERRLYVNEEVNTEEDS